MQPCRSTEHGNFPAAWLGGEGSQRRTACGLSARRQLPHDVCRPRVDANSHSLPPRSLHEQGRSGLQLADAGAAASHQPDFSRAYPVRACRETGAARRASCRYLVGCDGARSVVRKAIGAELVGDAIVQRVQSTYIRAPDLISRQICERAWGTGVINPRRSGMVYAIDGSERWLVHNYLKPDESDFESVDRDGSIRTILG